MRIILVEDDNWQSQWIFSHLKKSLKTIPEQIFTEHEFQRNFESYKENRPDVVIMDVMLPWTEADEDMEPRPPNVIEEGAYRAGFRCRELLASDEKTKNIPVILYTVLDKNDLESELEGLPENVVFLLKDSDAEPLIKEILRLTSLSSK
jgi:CheY-like chemotaxis protein